MLANGREFIEIKDKALRKAVGHRKEALVLLSHLIVFIETRRHQHLKERSLTDTRLVTDEPQGDVVLTDTQRTSRRSNEPFSKQMTRSFY